MRSKTQGIILCVLLLIAVATSVVIDLIHSRNETRSRGFASAGSMSFLISAWLEGSFREVDYVVRNVVDVIQPNDLNPSLTNSERRSHITAFLQAKHLSLPHSAEIGILDPRCRLIYALYSPIGWDASHRDYCKSLQANPQQDHLTTNLLWSNLDKFEVLHLRPLTDREGRLTGIAGAGLDLSFFQRWLDRVHVGPYDTLAIIDERGRIIARHMTNQPQGQVAPGSTLDKTLLSHFDLTGSRSGTRSFVAVLAGRPALVSLQHLDNQPMWVLVGLDEATLMHEWHIKAIQFGLGLTLLTLLIILLIRNMSLAEERAALLYLQANTDPMTRLPNRRHFLETAAREMARANRCNSRTGFILLDIDNFKEINDRHGHQAGDRAIIAVADACMAISRDSDTPGRLGGDEFVILLSDTDENGCETLAWRLLECIRSASLLNEEGEPITLTASIGIAVSEPGEGLPETPMTRADRALYEAKRTGRDTVRLAARQHAMPVA